MDKRYYDYITITPPIFFKFKMNRIVLIFSALALFAACEKFEDEIVPDGGLHAVTLPDVICASMSGDDMDPKTRTWLGGEEGKDVLWHGDDEISYFTGNIHANYVSQGAGDSSVEFRPGDKEQAAVEFAVDGTVAIYPYDSYNDPRIVEGKNVIYTMFPSIQTYAADSFGKGANVMVAKSETAGADNLYFRNACGYLVIKLYGADTAVKSIVLSSRSGLERISGSAYVSVDQSKDPEVTMTNFANSTITLDCSNGGEGVQLGVDKEHATEFWFALPPVTFEKGFKILVTPTKGLAFEMQTSKKIEVTRNDIRPMAALQFTQNVQTSDQPAPNQFFYTRFDGSTEPISFNEVVENKPFVASYDSEGNPITDATIKKHYYSENIGKIIIECDVPIIGIKDYAFNEVKINSVSLPNQLKTIGEGVFANTDLQSIVIPGSVTLIGSYAFSYNYSLKSISFLEGDEPLEIRYLESESIEDLYGPFDRSQFTYIYLNRNINYTDEKGDERDYGGYLARVGSCRGLFALAAAGSEPLELEIGPEVTELLPMMFDGNPIVNLVIPGTVNTIRNDAFCNLNKLETVTFLPSPTNAPLSLDPAYIVNVGDNSTFYRADKIKEVYIDRDIDYTLSGVDASEGIFSGKSALTKITLGEQARTLSKYMFYNCDGLTSLNIPSTVTSIGMGAFEDCDGLTSATISSSTLGSYMFDGCDNLASVTIDGTLDIINADAFSGCSNLSTLNISGQVGTIGTKAFKDKDKMTSFTVTGSVGTIGASAFEDSDALKTVSITGTVNEVCEYAFSDCDNITTLSIRANKVGDRAYEDMDGLISATLYGATVGDGVFYDCNALQTVIIDGGVNSIGDDAFYNCGKLSSVTFNEGINTLTIGYQPSSTDDLGPFYQSPLATINLNRELEPSATYKEQLDAWDMGIFTNKHYNDTDLTTTVTLGSNVQTIWPWMFSCVRMQNIEIPASVTSIGKEAFSYCYILDTVTCKGSTPPTLGEDVFYKSLKYIYVPSGSLGSYQSKWSDYEDLLHEK